MDTANETIRYCERCQNCSSCAVANTTGCTLPTCEDDPDVCLTPWSEALAAMLYVIQHFVMEQVEWSNGVSKTSVTINGSSVTVNVYGDCEVTVPELRAKVSPLLDVMSSDYLFDFCSILPEPTCNWDVEVLSPPTPPSPTTSPTASPAGSPTSAPSALPTASPTASPTVSPTDSPTDSPSASLTETTTTAPTAVLYQTTLVMTAEGSVETVNRTAIACSVAHVVGAECDEVNVTVTAGSVVVKAVYETEDEAKATVAQSRLTFTNETEASDALGLTVTATPSVPTINVVPVVPTFARPPDSPPPLEPPLSSPPPPPPRSPLLLLVAAPSDSDSLLPLIGAVSATACCLVGCCMCAKRRRKAATRQPGFFSGNGNEATRLARGRVALTQRSSGRSLSVSI